MWSSGGATFRVEGWTLDGEGGYLCSGYGVQFDTTNVLGRKYGPTVGRLSILATRGLMRPG